MSSYYRINSRLKSSTGVNYLVLNKKTKKKESIRVVIQGAQRPGDIEQGNIPVTFISGDEYNELIKSVGDKESIFSLLIGEGKKTSTPKNPVHGIIVQECGFREMSEIAQKKYNPTYYAKLEAQRANQALKDQEAYDAEHKDDSED